METLTALIREDATQSMPPYDLWLRGRDNILAWWVGPGAGCRGSRVIPTLAANGAPAFGQYKPNSTGEGFEPWALQVLEFSRAGSSSSPSSSIRRPSSRSSTSPSGSTRRAPGVPASGLRAARRERSPRYCPSAAG